MALGDSYAAGVGNSIDSYFPNTVPQSCSPADASGSNGTCPYGGVCPGGASCLSCKRSRVAWPQLVQDHLATLSKAAPFRSVACSGAVIGDIDGTSKSGQNQLKAAATDLANAKYVTLSVGGNDIGFSKEIRACLAVQTAAGAPVSPANLPADPSKLVDSNCTAGLRMGINPKSSGYRLGGLTNELMVLFRKIRQKAPFAKIFVTGYPEIVSKSGGPWLASEVAAFKDSAAALDRIISQACSESDANVSFVEISKSFRGKGCRGSPQLINCAIPIPAQADRSYHPNEAGNREYADLVIKAL